MSSEENQNIAEAGASGAWALLRVPLILMKSLN